MKGEEFELKSGGYVYFSDLGINAQVNEILQDERRLMLETLEELARGVDMPFVMSAVNGVVQPVPMIKVQQVMELIKERFEKKLKESHG